MKIFGLLICLPLVFSLPQKRLVFDTITHIFDFSALKGDLQIMLDVLGADPTEMACESECHKVLTQGQVLHYGCPLVCHAFQSLIQQFHLTTPMPVVSGGNSLYSGMSKRVLLDSLSSFFDYSNLKNDLQIMLDQLGSDPTEAACETECHKLITTGHVLNYGCPLVCHAFQNLVKQLHLTTPMPMVVGGKSKRVLLDSIGSFFDFTNLKADLQIMLDVLGSDPTEMACEAECHKLLASGHVLNYGCPLVCHTFQSLVGKFHLTTPVPMVNGGPVKRVLLDSISTFFDFSNLKADLQIMLDALGSDPTEMACEAECHKLLSTGHVLNYGCPLVCHTFQQLVHQFHLTTPSTVVW